jgi:hypothetical protein
MTGRRWKLRIVVYGSLLVAALAGVGVWWLAFGRLAPPARHDRGDNGLWMTRHWLHGGSGTSTGELAKSLRELGVRRVYPFLGPMDHTGWPGWRDEGVIRRYDPETATRFLREMERVAPEVLVLPWTGGVLDRDVRLDDEEQRRAFAEHMQWFTEHGADGVHLNIEPLPSFEPGFLDLLREVKAAIGNGKLLSVAAYPPPTPLHPHPDVHWTLPFYREVCLVADEVVVMAYDTAQRVPVVYETLVADWVRDLIENLPPPEEGGCQWSIGVPAYEDDEPWHDPETETIEHGIRGVLRGLAGRETPSGFTGIAVYASWTTDRDEWATYEHLWRGREPSTDDLSRVR